MQIGRKLPREIWAGLTDVEKEVICLWVVCGSLDSFINHIVIDLVGQDGMKQVHFKTLVHQRLFSILLQDFQESVRVPIELERGCVDLLQHACRTASFNKDGSIDGLKNSVNALETWLNETVTIDPWMPTIGQQVQLTIQRRDIVYLCGNISKHNLGRLTGVAGKLEEILNQHRVEADTEGGLLAIGDIYEHLHDNILNYQATVIVEFLNNIRWGIHDYLTPEYLRAVTKHSSDPVRYFYQAHPNIRHRFGRLCYEDLMNSIRLKPCMEKFIASNSLKLHY